MPRTLSSFVKIEAGNSSAFILFQHKPGTNATVLVMDCLNWRQAAPTER